MNAVILRVCTLIACLCCSFSVMAAADKTPALDLNKLLEQVKQGRAHDNAVNRQRLSEFESEQALQQKKLADITAEQARQEDISKQRELQFEQNEQLIDEIQKRLSERLGSLKELFGTLQQVSSDAQAQFSASNTQIQNPDRNAYLVAFSAKMGQTDDLPSIEEIERLWYELQWEMTESGKVVKLTQPVLTNDGEERQQELIRVGSFSLVSEGHYYQYVPETSRVVEFGRQPHARYLAGAREIATATDAVSFTIDPTRGQLMALLVQAPNLRERVEQGGVIGYLIICLGLSAFLVAIYRLVILTIANRKIEQQLQNLDVPGDNPLGRVLRVYRSGDGWNTETLELKLGEAILRELPQVNRGLNFLKIVAAVAPLMGLLGTVTGMIITFQAITLFGAGDPKLMAGGISQALVTTVLGLTVAIPTLLMHQLVHTRARRINDVLEQEAVALTALRAED